MELFPAIDILDNKVVRLSRGDYDKATIYHDSALEQARRFAHEGARWLHIVDLEGARSGAPTQIDTIAAIVADTGLKVEVGGGIRQMEHIQDLVDAGVSRVVLGTGLVLDPIFANEAISRFGDLLCAGIDARDGEVAVEGWLKGSGLNAEELVGSLSKKGLRHLVYTDIQKDGMQTGIDALAYRHIAQLAGFAVTASGGISTLEDIRALAQLGRGSIEAIIVGRALYEQTFSVAQAFEILEEYVD